MTEKLASPCISICQINPASGLCQGCWRSRDEIASWPFLDREQQQAMLWQLHDRRAKATGQMPRRRRRAAS